jgi:hypothetical protein
VDDACKRNQILSVPAQSVLEGWGHESIHQHADANGMVPASLRSNDQCGLFVTSRLVKLLLEGSSREDGSARYGSDGVAAQSQLPPVSSPYTLIQDARVRF